MHRTGAQRNDGEKAETLRGHLHRVRDLYTARTLESKHRAKVSFDSGAAKGLDLDRLLSGSFKIVVSGPAAAGFESNDGKAELQLTFAFAAFE